MVSLLIAIFILSNTINRSQAPAVNAHYACEGMVVSAHPLATEVGLAVLKAGGNAFDAAIAVEFTLAVVFPAAGNIGGGGFALLHTADGEVKALDYREQAASAMQARYYLEEDGTPIPGASTLGPLAVGIPGTVAGMYALHAQYGQLPWFDLLNPAIQLASAGWQLTAKESDLLNEHRKSLRALNGDCYLCSEIPYQAGQLMKNEVLAQTLTRIRDEGAFDFYQGYTAEKLSDFMRDHGGIITQTDLEHYQAIWRQPLVGRFQKYDVLSMGPPSSGAVVVLQMLQMLEDLPLHKWSPTDPRYVHHFAEAARRAYADRATHLGDPAFYPVPVEQLLAPEYLDKRKSSIKSKKASKSTDIQAGFFELTEKDETTHYIVVDGNRNIMSATTSLNGAYGSKVIVPELGFLLNNTIDDFSMAPGLANSYGLVGSAANAPQGGKRMLSSMSPTIVLEDGLPVLVTGSPGGSTIPTTVVQVLLNSLVHEMNAQQAVTMPRFHHQWLPDEVQYESGSISKRARRILGREGHTLRERKPYGRAECVRIHGDGTLEGGADPRGDDTVLGR
ncbi:MAG: gamma-glutamyltransferase [Bacteroidia bacterium]